MRRRLLSTAAFALPEHLKSQPFLTRAEKGRCMVVGNPHWRYPIAVVPSEPKVTPLVEAIRSAPQRPFRIVSHEDEHGRVFNASFFEDADTMHGFLEWYAANALDPEGEYHNCLESASAVEAGLPSNETLLFGRGSDVLADTRFGEYQLGMAVRYTAWELRSQETREEACVEAASAEFEERIASCMQANGVAYFGRLLMMDGPVVDGHPGVMLSAVRYGSVADAHKGSQLSRELVATELDQWFAPDRAKTIIGTAQRVLEV